MREKGRNFVTPPKITARDIGTPAYQELLRQEAEFWERSARGETDNSVAAWRDTDLIEAAWGDLLQKTLDLAVANGPRVLELACADAETSMQLARRGCVATGVDVAMGLLRHSQEIIRTQRSAEHWPGDVRLFVGDLNRLGLAPEAFDVVLAMAALHHTIDLEDLTDQILKTLKPGGLLICMDHMEASPWGLLARYACLFFLPTEVPYWRKPLHLFNRVMARVYRRFLPRQAPPPAFTLPDHSPFEAITGAEAIAHIRRRFQVEHYQTYLAFADVVSGHLRLGSHAREVKLTRGLRRLDDWLIRHLGLRGQTYYLVARKPKA